jgi:hypothetical protein
VSFFSPRVYCMSRKIFVQTVYIYYICVNSVKATYHTHSASKKCYSGWRHLVNKVRELFTEAKDKREDGIGVQVAEVGRSATCSAMRNSTTCATRKFAADVRFNPQGADCGIAPLH